MDPFTEDDDLSSMMDSAEIPTLALNCANSVANSVKDTNHATRHDGDNSVFSVRDKSKNDLVSDKSLHGTSLDPALLTVSSLEDYSDVSSCSEADFSNVSNILEKNAGQSSDCQDTGQCREKNELKKDFSPEGQTAWAPSDNATEKQDYVCRASGTKCVSGGVDNHLEASLNLDLQCPNLSTITDANGSPLKTGEEMDEGLLTQNADCGVTESSRHCKETAVTQLSSVCALDLNAAKHRIEEKNTENSISPGNIGGQNDCYLKGINNTDFELKQDVKNAVCDNEPDYGRTGSSQEFEHSSFEFLQSCFGFNNLDTKLDQNAALSLSRSMTQNCKVNHTHTPIVAKATCESTMEQTKEAVDDGRQEPSMASTCSSNSVSQEPGQQNVSTEDQIINGLARTKSTYDTRTKNSASLLSSQKLLRKLQPVVLVKTKCNAKEKNLYVCTVCKENTQNLDELIEHHHCEHTKQTFQYCLTCGAYFSNGTLAAQHLCERIGPNDMQHADAVLPELKQQNKGLKTKYLCKYCQKPFIKVSYYQDHEQRHITVTPHRCDCCGLYFATAKKLIAHRQKIKCSPLIVEPDKQITKCSKIDSKNLAKPNFTFGVDGCQIGLHDCFVKLVDINKKQSPQKINCPICGKKFTFRAQMKAHLQSHTDAKPFICNMCKRVFKYSWNLDKHKKEQCCRKIKRRHISKSITGKPVGRFTCPICPQVFRYSYNRTRHLRKLCLNEYMRMGKGKVGNRYKCPLCSDTFSLSSSRNRHIKNTCLEQYKLQRNTIKIKLIKERVKEEKEEKQALPSENLPCYKCKLCPATFAYKSGVYRHMKKHSLLQLPVPEVKQDNPTDLKGTDSNNETPQSQVCSSQNSSDMVTSLPFHCNFCDKSFDSSDSLNDHVQLHGGKKPFHCLDCGKRFGRRGHLIAHKNVHKRRIQCSVCKKIVPTIGDLLKHRKTHIKKGILQCPDCPMQFKFPVFLLRHVASHAKKEAMLKLPLPAETSSKISADVNVKEIKEPFTCGICQKAFVDSKTLTEHCLTHIPKPSDSKCPVCKHNFTSRTALIRHIRLHTGEKPFPCKTCGTHFRRKEALSFHQNKCKRLQEKPVSPSSTPAQTHKKNEVKAASKPVKVQKKFACSYCPHTFFTSGNLKLHEKAHLANNLIPCLKCEKYYKSNKIYGHRKRCNIKESTTGDTFNSDTTGSALKDECKDINVTVPKRTCRLSKELSTNVNDYLKERCPHCPKRFQFKCYLRRHLRTHLGKKQFACKHCGLNCGNQSSCQKHEALCDGVLRKYEAKHLNESKDKKIMPDTSAILKKCTVIRRENGELKCSFCAKIFAKPRNLRRHILTHTDVKPYHCKTCEKGFSRHDHLKKHQTRCKGNKQHSSFKPFSCKRCGTRFTSKDSLKRHAIRVNCKMSSAKCLEPVQIPTRVNTSVQPCRETSKLVQRIEGHYSSKWKYQCEYCPRRFKTHSQLTIHTRLHTGEKPFGCVSCDERFIRRDYLKRHLTKCRKRDGPKVLCDRCGELFTQEALVTHQNNCIISLKSTDGTVSLSSISSPSKVKAFSCVNCSERFLLFSQLQHHILTKHRSEGLQQSGILKYAQLSSNLHVKEEPVDGNYAQNLPSSYETYANNGLEKTDGEREKPFECELCNMRFITNSGLGMHMRTHRTIYPLSCHKCNKGFWSKNVQQKHIRKCNGLEVTQPKTKGVNSLESEYTPNDKVLLFNKGSNTTGTGVLQTKFSCKDQDKGHADKADAVVHKYQCSECEQSFTDGLMLISHLEAHGREDQERRLGKSHHCHICDKTFDQTAMLQRHLRTQHQEPVTNTCPECFKNFRYPSDLDIHRSCHDPNRPFVCNTCELRFWTHKSLIAHQRMAHSVIEPFKTIEPTPKTDRVLPKVFTCNPCNKIYTVKGSYLKHCRVKHKGCSKILDDSKSATPEHQLSNNESDESGADDKDISDDSDSAPYFPCHVCGKTFLTSESLEDHQRCHLGEKPYECEECGKCFVQLVNLQQHQRSHKSEFQCQMCGKGFVSLFALRKHKHTHVRKHPHRCTKCHLSFTRSSQLTEHMITHRDEENFPCDLCHENFSCKSSRAEHRKVHAEEELPPLIPPAKQISSPPVSSSPSSTIRQCRYRCEVCQVRFPDPEQLSEHGCNPAKERPYSCKDCNKYFLHGSHLKKHQLTHQLSGTQTFQCNSCHMSFSHRHHFLTHLQTHGGEESSKSPVNNEVKISTTDDSNQDRIYKCPICPESFSQVLELANHLSVHANMCKVCNKTFSTKQQLEKHEQCHLSAATQYECTECGKSFLGSEAFRQHYCVHKKHRSCSSMPTTDKKRCLENASEVLANNEEEEEEVDVGEDFFNCPTCNKRFSSNVSLQEHQKLHGFDRPFKCLVCGKGFTKKKYLTQHQQIHNERPYQCKVCPSSFKTEQSLASHHKTHDAHRKYHCSVCDKSYKTPYDLSRHEQKHPELQTFSEVSGDHRCDMCYKSFSLLSQLRQHQETHVGQVVYECTECDKAFAFVHLLEEHQQTHRTSADSFQS